MPEPNTKTPLLAGKKPPVSRPKAHRRRSSYEASTYNSAGRSLSYSKKAQDEDTSIPGLSLWKILTLTVCMAGVQFTCKSCSSKKPLLGCCDTDIMLISPPSFDTKKGPSSCRKCLQFTTHCK